MFRKVKARIWLRTTKTWEYVTGKFHLWGMTYEELRENGAVGYTIAIIELEDGSIVTALPDDVRFIE